MSVEKTLSFDDNKRRYDLVLFEKANPYILFEFKSFNQSLNEDTCLQIAQYNMQLQVPYLILSNGIKHYGFNADFESRQIKALDSFPWTTL